MKKTLEQIDALLPQTQCGLCEYDGCKPYARAMLEDGAALDRCLPGGVDTLLALGDYFSQDIRGLIPGMLQKQKPVLKALIREDQCIGCTKCIQACPVDAIAGAAKLMHSVLDSECTGCELCVEPCPMDCIDMIRLAVPSKSDYYKKHSPYWRQRYEQRQQRLASNNSDDKPQALIGDDEDYITKALARAKAKRDQV